MWRLDQKSQTFEKNPRLVAGDMGGEMCDAECTSPGTGEGAGSNPATPSIGFYRGPK